jgi:hypothetical protein
MFALLRTSVNRRAVSPSVRLRQFEFLVQNLEPVAPPAVIFKVSSPLGSARRPPSREEKGSITIADPCRAYLLSKAIASSLDLTLVPLFSTAAAAARRRRKACTSRLSQDHAVYRLSLWPIPPASWDRLLRRRSYGIRGETPGL